MKTIKLKNIRIQNFKGCKERMVEFGDNTRISGANATGKTTMFDAFTWLLFNKDSLGSTQFDIRPKDSDGKMIDNVEISVEAVIAVGEEEYSLKKVQKQKWVKKRGTDTTEFQGNINEFEINGYPKSEKEFKEFIGNIIDEKVFNLVTNPSAFNALPWKEQREMLMKFVGNFTDVQIAEECKEKFTKLIPELKIASTDDILKKYTKAKNILNKDMVEIPARIDEVSKQLVIVDVGALEVEKTVKEVALRKVEDELSGGVGKLEEINNLRQQVIDLKMKSSEIQNRANEELSQKRSEVREKCNAAENEYRNISKEIHDMKHEKDSFIRQKDAAEHEKNRLLSEWKAEKSKIFPDFVQLGAFVEPEPIKDSDLVCPTCGQELPEEVKQKRITDHNERCERAKADYKARCEAHKSKYEKNKVEFDKQKEENLKRITENGQKAADAYREFQRKADDIQKDINALNVDLEVAKDSYMELKAELDKLPSVTDVSSDSDYKEVQESIISLEEKVQELSRESTGRTELEARKRVIQDEITEIEMKIKSADNSKIEARIAELEAEKSAVGQKIAEQEQMIALTEDFIRTKMNRISSVINEKFRIVSFKLFDNQINGGLKECCECTVNGIPFSSLNNGHRIIAGLDIIRSLSELNGVSCPVFIDNSEAVNENNFPEMQSQMIHLTVTDDKELKVEEI